MEARPIPSTVEELVRLLRSPDIEARGTAWQNAGPLSAPAVAPVMALMDDPDFETARSAKRALQAIVRFAGRPTAVVEARAVEGALIAGAKRLTTLQARRDAIWMLSEIGESATIRHLSACLMDEELREDARAALMRIPGDEALAALRQSHGAATGEFRDALAEALSHRGHAVPGFESQKLKPSKTTTVGSSPV